MSFFKQADDRHAQEDQQGGIGSASKDRTIIIVALAFSPSTSSMTITGPGRSSAATCWSR